MFPFSYGERLNRRAVFTAPVFACRNAGIFISAYAQSGCNHFIGERKKMKTVLKLEYLALIGLGMAAFGQTGCSWWWFAGLFFAPDLSMLGYLVNTKAGTVCYNIFHHLAVAVLIFLIGKQSGITVLEAAGSILLAHSAFDRLLGYGLKYGSGFKHTHLGTIGR